MRETWTLTELEALGEHLHERPLAMEDTGALLDVLDTVLRTHRALGRILAAVPDALRDLERANAAQAAIIGAYQSEFGELGSRVVSPLSPP